MKDTSKLFFDDNNWNYDEILTEWREASIPDDVFSGHLLVSMISESSIVEGIDMSYNRTREIFESEVVSGYSGDVRDLFSIMNNKTVAEFYNDSLKEGKKITLDFIKKTHEKLMFASIDKHRYHDNNERAGSFKQKDYCVGKYSVGVPPDEVESYLCDLLETIGDVTPNNVLKMATIFHCYFENIHPFADGNGRVGRWLLNYFLVLNNHPPIVIRGEHKEKYYECLERFDVDGSFDAMYDFLKGETVYSYNVFKYLL